MEQLNQILTGEEQLATLQKETQSAAVTPKTHSGSPLLNKVRQKFEITGLVSLLFGGLFALGFYNAYVGLNALLFTAVMILLLAAVMKLYEVPVKSGTYLYYAGALLSGLSITLTDNESLQFMNLILILCLLNLSLLHQLHDTKKWDFISFLGKMFAMLLYGIAAIGYPFIDGLNFLKKTKLLRSDRSRNIIVGVLISVPILWIVIVLLSQADMIFGNMTRELMDHIISEEIFVIIFMVLFGFFSCYCIICGAAAQTGKQETQRRRGAASTAITVILLITLIYLFFCGLQMLYLFSSGLFTLPEGYTFAEYARRGFFELLAVAVLNVALMLITTAYFEESRFLRFLLTVMTACTYILIGSATYRMLLYIGAYHLTFLRLFVLLALLILSFLLAGVILSIYRKSFPLFRYSVVVITVFYLAFSFSKPDYYIASYLEKHQKILTSEDAAFLTGDLSLDAASIVLPLLSEDTRFTEGAKQGSETPQNTYEYELGSRSELYNLDFYRGMYYTRIQSEKSSRGFRDFDYSIARAYSEAQRYPRENK